MTPTYQQIIRSALAENTRVSYAKGWQRFKRFCDETGHSPLPAAAHSVAEFLIRQATEPVRKGGGQLSMGTLMVYRSAINHKHKDAGLPSPTDAPEVTGTVRGLQRLRGAPARRVKALREYDIAAMLDACGGTPIGLRNAAVIALGFAAAMRRSEICNLKVEDVQVLSRPRETRPGKALLTIRKSKTDPRGRGQKIAIIDGESIRPIARLGRWTRVSGVTEGALFRSMRRGGAVTGNPLHSSDVARIVKHYAVLVGLDAREVAGHSLRAGFVTSAAAHHARLDKIMEITRHRNPATVLKYIRDADCFDDHAGAQFL